MMIVEAKHTGQVRVHRTSRPRLCGGCEFRSHNNQVGVPGRRSTTLAEPPPKRQRSKDLHMGDDLHPEQLEEDTSRSTNFTGAVQRSCLVISIGPPTRKKPMELNYDQ